MAEGGPVWTTTFLKILVKNVPFIPCEYSFQLLTTKEWSNLFDDDPISAKQSQAAWKWIELKRKLHNNRVSCVVLPTIKTIKLEQTEGKTPIG